MKLSSVNATSLVREAIIEVAPDVIDDLDALDPDVDLWDVLELDSMDHQTVMALLVDRTGVDIAERDYPRLRSLSALSEHLVAGPT